MAEIRQYRKVRNRQADNTPPVDKDDDYESKLKNHKRKITRIGIIAGVIMVILIIVLIVSNKKSSYTSYNEESSIRRNDSSYAEYHYFGGHIVRCSKDGIAAISYNGKQLWNSTYEINNISVEYNGSYMAVADLNGNSIYTFDKNGKRSSINTALPILQISVSKAGLVAAILEDRNAYYINMYTIDGEKVCTIKRTIVMDGMPISISVSDDGEKIVAAFTRINGVDVDTNVVFFSFNEVGQTENERIVGGFDYGNELVGKVKFVNASTVIVYGEKTISIYNINEYPELVKSITAVGNIKSVFYNSSYFGMVYYDSENTSDRVAVYNLSGNKVYDEIKPEEITEIKLISDKILMYGENKCYLMNFNGKAIYEDVFEDGIVNLIPIGEETDYIYINQEYIKKIKLK